MAIKLRWIAAAAIVAAAVVTGYKNYTQGAGEMGAVKVTTIDKKQIQFADLQKQGKVTVVNFWATSCSTCMKEMPHMVKMYQELNPKGLEFVGVAMQYDNPAYVKNYVNDKALPFNVAWDGDGKLSTQFGNIIGTPTTFVIDAKGKIIKKYVGEPDWTDIYATIEKELPKANG